MSTGKIDTSYSYVTYSYGLCHFMQVWNFAIQQRNNSKYPRYQSCTYFSLKERSHRFCCVFIHQINNEQIMFFRTLKHVKRNCLVYKDNLEIIFKTRMWFIE